MAGFRVKIEMLSKLYFHLSNLVDAFNQEIKSPDFTAHCNKMPDSLDFLPVLKTVCALCFPSDSEKWSKWLDIQEEGVYLGDTW